MAGGIEVEGDGRAVRLAKDAIGEVGDQERWGAGGKGEALGGESVGPDRKGEVGEALKVCGGEGGGSGGERRGGVGEKEVGGGRATGNWHGDGRAARQINIGERGHSNLVACGRQGHDLGGRSTHYNVRGKR